MHGRVCAFDIHIHLGGGVDEGRDERQKERKLSRHRAAGGGRGDAERIKARALT